MYFIQYGDKNEKMEKPLLARYSKLNLCTFVFS